MILEVAILNVIPGQEDAFLEAFGRAQDIISGMAGYISHKLKRCIENASQFILLVEWKKLTDHTVGFRKSKEYQQWKALLHHFYNPFPTVEHYEDITGRENEDLTSPVSHLKSNDNEYQNI